MIPDAQIARTTEAWQRQRPTQPPRRSLTVFGHHHSLDTHSSCSAAPTSNPWWTNKKVVLRQSAVKNNIWHSAGQANHESPPDVCVKRGPAAPPPLRNGTNPPRNKHINAEGKRPTHRRAADCKVPSSPELEGPNSKYHSPFLPSSFFLPPTCPRVQRAATMTRSFFPRETYVVIMKFEQGVASRPRALPLHLALSATKY